MIQCTKIIIIFFVDTSVYLLDDSRLVIDVKVNGIILFVNRFLHFSTFACRGQYLCMDICYMFLTIINNVTKIIYNLRIFRRHCINGRCQSCRITRNVVIVDKIRYTSSQVKSESRHQC